MSPDPCDVQRSLLDDLRAKRPELAARADGGAPLAAIRLFCLHCLGGSPDEVKACSAPWCALYHYRLGRSPRPARQMSEEQRTAARERLAAMRARKGEEEDEEEQPE